MNRSLRHATIQAKTCCLLADASVPFSQSQGAFGPWSDGHPVPGFGAVHGQAECGGLPTSRQGIQFQRMRGGFHAYIFLCVCVCLPFGS